MSTDACHPSTSATATRATVVVAVNQGPVDSGIRLPVERISLDEPERRQQADKAGAALPTHVGVLHSMIAELRQALAAQKQRVAELEQAMDALARRLQRTPRDAWLANQPALFPEAQAAPAEAAVASAPTPAEPDGAAAATAASGTSQKKKGHGRRSLEELLKSLPLQRCAHPLTEAERVC